MNPAAIKMFWTWVIEREAIRQRRAAGDSWPWTKDVILQRYRFTNVFRQHDRMTIELQGEVKHFEKLVDRVFAILVYRLFNRSTTYIVLRPLIPRWRVDLARRQLNAIRATGQPVMTGVWMTPGLVQGRPVFEGAIRSLNYMYHDRKNFCRDITYRSLGATFKYLIQYPMIGNFVGYQMTLDFRDLIAPNVIDASSFVVFGPGAIRGARRIHAGVDAKDVATYLLAHQPKTAPRGMIAQDIEHCLCEFDKYARAYYREGQPRNRYRPPKEIK